MADLLSTIIDGSVTEKIGTGAATNATVTVDLSTGNFFKIDMADSNADIATFTITKPALSSTVISSFVIHITQGSTARQFTWASLSAIKWVGGAPGRPSLTITDNAIDVLSLTTYDNGTTWHGQAVGFNYS